MDHKLTADLLASNSDEYAKQLDVLKKSVADLTARSGVSDDLKQAQSASLNAVLNRRQKDLDGAKAAVDAMANSVSSGQPQKNNTHCADTIYRRLPR